MTLSQDPSLIEYARFHQVSTDHLTANPLALLPLLLESVHDPLSDPKEAPDIGLSFSQDAIEKRLQREKLEIDRNAAIFLSSIIKDESIGKLRVAWEDYLPNYEHYSKLKVDVPLLKLSEECDTASIRRQRNLDITTMEIPLENIEDENDEGLEFPSYCWRLPDEIRGEIESEKLECPRDALLFLQEIQPDEVFSNNDMTKLIETRLHSASKMIPDTLSPLILPQDAQDTTPVSEFIGTEGSIESCAGSLCHVERSEIGERSSSIKSSLSPPVSLAKESNDQRSSQLHPEESFQSTNATPEVEAQALRPTQNTVTPVQELIKLSASAHREVGSMLTTVLSSEIDMMRPTMREATSTSGHTVNGSPMQCMTLDVRDIQLNPNQQGPRFVEPHVKSIVPPLSFPLLVPPWERSRLQLSERPEEQVIDSFPLNMDNIWSPYMSDTKWLPTSELDKNLVWDPFQSLAANAEVEDIWEETGLVEEYWDFSCVERSSAFLPEIKEPRLFMTEPVDIEAASLMVSNLENEGMQRSRSDNPITLATTAAVMLKKRKGKKAISKALRGLHTKTYCQGKGSLIETKRTDSASPSLYFSALGSLSNYMDTRGKGVKRRRVDQSHNSVTSLPDAVIPGGPEIGNHEADICSCESIHVNMNLDSLNPLCSTSSKPDNIPQLMRDMVFMVSAKLLKTDLNIIQNLENLTSPPTLIFRDYEKLNENGGYKYIPASKTSWSTRTIEADIIVSPQIGIIFTTLQESTQLYLPGHKAAETVPDGFPSFESPIRERIARLAIRYEKLYILVRLPLYSPEDDNVGGSKAMKTDQRTIFSSLSLTAFCASISSYSTVVPIMVMSSDYETLRWVVLIANKSAFTTRDQIASAAGYLTFAPIDDDVNLQRSGLCMPFLHEESQWELFLRYAGFNPFAAQSILGILGLQRNDPTRDLTYNVDSTSTHVLFNSQGMRASATGIALFIELSSQERRKIFAHIVGERVLNRVGSIIDRDWELDWAIHFPTEFD